jgi:cystathionine beta-lyase/cystathionine gamma-synthase
MPIYQVTTFRHPGLGESTGFDYSRTSNPTRQVLEEVLATAEGGSKAVAFPSGMAAVDCFLRLFKPGEKILVLEDLYGGTWRILESVFRPWGLQIQYISCEDLEYPERLSRHGQFAGLFLETPTNPTLKISNIANAVSLAKSHGAIVAVDNTFLTFCLQRPLDLGADLVVYSSSKYLGGHNDVLSGVLVAKTAELGERLAKLQNTTGAVLGPWDSWLLLRGLKTLPLRLKQQQQNALTIANWLLSHPAVADVFYPGLPGHPSHAVHQSQASGAGGMLSFTLRNPAKAATVLSKVKLWLFAESLGGVESLITLPVKQTHADVPEATRIHLGIVDSLFRLSVGIENAQDLIQDLAQALED